VPVGNDRQLLDIERDLFDTVLGERCTIGQHDRDRFADIANPLRGNDRLTERLRGRRGLQPERYSWHGADLGRGDHGVHAADCQRRLRGDGANTGMCNRAAHDGRMQHSVTREVGDVFAAPAQEAEILDPLDWGTDIAVDEGHDLSALRYAAPASSTASTIGM
jgi:hypothetical protein